MIRCVRFGLLICWIDAHLPSAFLGSPLAQGVGQTSLRGWSNSYLSKDKQNIVAVLMNSFSKHLGMENFMSYTVCSLDRAQVNSLIISFTICCSNKQLSPFHVTFNISG